MINKYIKFVFSFLLALPLSLQAQVITSARTILDNADNIAALLKSRGYKKVDGVRNLYQIQKGTGVDAASYFVEFGEGAVTFDAPSATVANKWKSELKGLGYYEEYNDTGTESAFSASGKPMVTISYDSFQDIYRLTLYLPQSIVGQWVGADSDFEFKITKRQGNRIAVKDIVFYRVYECQQCSGTVNGNKITIYGDEDYVMNLTLTSEDTMEGKLEVYGRMMHFKFKRQFIGYEQ